MSDGTISAELAETSETGGHLSAVQRNLPRGGLRGRVAAKKPKLQPGTEAKRLSYAANMGSEMLQNGSRCSGVMSPNVKYMAGAEGSLFTQGLDSGT